MSRKFPLKKKLNRAISPVLRDHLRLVRHQAAVERLEDRTLLSVTSISVNAIHPTEGTPFGSQTTPAQVATFDVNNYIGIDESSQYSAEINWGDGTESAGLGPLTVTFLADLGNGNAEYSVNSYHTYTEGTPVGNPLSLTVELFDNGPGTTQAASGPVTVNDAMLSQSALPAITATAGTALTNADVADFTDANPYAQASDLSASVTFASPSQTVPGVIVEDASGVFHVLASHTYNGTAGGTSSPIEISVTHGTASLSMQNSATVSPSPMTGSAGNEITGVEGNSTGSVLLGTFVDGDQAATTANYTTGGGSAVVNWGDGSAPQTLTASNLTDIGTGAGTTWIVSAPHTYAEEGTYAYTVTVTNEDGAATIVSGSAHIADAPLTAGPAIPPTTVTEGFVVLPTAQLFDFTDGNASATTADFAATVDWGDGTPTSTGVIGQFNPGSFFVTSGGHTYDQVGTYNIKITVQDIEYGGSEIQSESGAISVIDAALSNGMSDSIFGVAGQSLNNVLLGTFQDGDPDATAADFTAGVTWGDSSPVNDGVVSLIGATSSNTTFAVYGSHVYSSGGVYTFSVAVVDKDGSTLTPFNGSATISALSAGPGVPATGNTGIVLSSNDVGSFTDANPTAPTSDFTATIDWGDGSPQSAGVIIQPGGMGTSFRVEGDHTYANPGVYDVSTNVVGDGTSTSLSASYAITDLPVSGSIKNFTAVEGQNTGQIVLATFEDPNTLATVSSVDATLPIGAWGDGTPNVSGVQLVTQQIGVNPSNGDPIFDVLGTHTFAEEGIYTVNIDVTTSGGVTTALTPATATVLDAPLTGSAGNEITGVEGSSTGTILLGTFVDGNQTATAADYTAAPGSVVVNWGDGSAPQTLSASNLTAIGSPNGVQWAISAAHTYTEEGTYSYTATVTDDGGSTAIIAGSAIIADAALTPGPATLLTANTGIALPGSAVVATFTDANTFATTNDYTSVVDWGDGSPHSTGIIVATATPGVFDVEAGHTYAKAGDYSTLVTVHDEGGAQVVITGSAAVTTPVPPPPPVNIVASAVLTPVDTILPGANTGTIAVATFTDAAPEPLGHYTATITWGDGHTSSGSISLSGGKFTVKGSNTYSNAGEYSPKVSIQKDALASKSVTDTDRVDVLVSAHVAADAGVTLTGLEGRTTSATVATFTAVNASNPASDYSATINWGDGTSSTVGTVVSLGGGKFKIVGTHVYHPDNTYGVTVTLKDTFGDTVTIKSTAKITDAPLELPTGKSLTVAHNSTFTNLVLGSFRDDDAVNTNPAEYVGTINWGDGSSTSAAKFVFTSATANLGSYWNVEGTHKYATAKTYTVTISIHDVDSPGDVILITTTIKAT